MAQKPIYSRLMETEETEEVVVRRSPAELETDEIARRRRQRELVVSQDKPTAAILPIFDGSPALQLR